MTGINVINPEADVHETFQLLSRTRVASHNLMNSKRRNPCTAVCAVCHTPSKQLPLPLSNPCPPPSPFRSKNWEKFSENFTFDSSALNANTSMHNTIGVDCKSEGNSFDEITMGEKELIPPRIRGHPGKSAEPRPIDLAFGSNRKLPAAN